MEIWLDADWGELGGLVRANVTGAEGEGGGGLRCLVMSGTGQAMSGGSRGELVFNCEVHWSRGIHGQGSFMSFMREGKPKSENEKRRGLKGDKLTLWGRGGAARGECRLLTRGRGGGGS